MASSDLKRAKEEQNPWEASQNSPSWIKPVAGRPAPPGLPCQPRAAAGLDPPPFEFDAAAGLRFTAPSSSRNSLHSPDRVKKEKNKIYLKKLSVLAADMSHDPQRNSDFKEKKKERKLPRSKYIIITRIFLVDLSYL